MAVMKILLICGFLFMQLIYATTNHQDDGFAFEESDTEVKVKEDGKILNIVPVHRVWGIPDTQTIVGKLFILQIPKDAFKGDIDHYEMVNYKNGGNREWPKWLEFDKSGIMKGVPLSQDVGIYYLTIIAVAPHSLYKSKDVFAIEVIKPGLDTRLPEDPIKIKCAEGSDPIMLTILVNNGIEDIEPKNRVAMIENIAGYYGLSSDMFYLHEERSSQDVWSFADTLYFIAGPGHVNKTTRKDFASVSFQIGCGRKVDSEYKSLILKIKAEAADGTLSEVLMQPVIGWHAKNELPIYFRDRRQVGSGGSGDLYEEDEEDEEDYNESVTTISTPHPHRHHHGEDVELINGTALLPSEVQYQLPSISFQNNYEDLISTPAFVPGRPTLITESTVSIEPTRVTDFSTFSTMTTPNLVHEAKTDESSHFQDTTVPLTLSTSEDNITETTSDVSSSSYGSTDQGTTDYLTTDSLKFNNIGVSGVSTVTSGTTEEMEPRNLKPTIAHRLKKVAVTAGKVLRFKIPENTFADIEDGSTSHMSLKFKTQDGKPIPPTSWIKFDAAAQEIKALPLEEHVSKWEFEVEATDKDGDSVSDTFELQIQHHRQHRAVNFEFSAHLILSNNWSSSVDWELKIIEALVSVYGDPDASHITLRSVTQTTSPVIFTWTNDTLPRTFCPRQEIDALMRVIADEDGDATDSFRRALEPDIFVKKITMQGIGQCESKPEIPVPQTPQENFSPAPRNQIDQVNATVGRLLVFKVPEDTFYDPEEGSTRKLKLSLYNMDRSPLDPHHWLQFDSKNQEFYGVPMDLDVRSQEYQLVCEDRQGLTANDGLIVVVFPRPKVLYNVEFSVALGVPYDSFVNSSAMKRKFFDKLREVFGDSNTDAIVLGSITEGSTIVTWYNQTLRTDICPDEDIQQIREKIMTDESSVNKRMADIFGAEFDVISVGLRPLGACEGGDTVLHKTESPPPPIDDNSYPIGVDEDYLFTFVIPAVLIALMLILSGIVACLFYRKRRASKMGIGDEDEKQSFRNKGIPVIFQDELDEKPEPENKCPVIMKEEKPPLPPPEYQRNQHNASTHELNEDAPYQPPPPFTSSRDTGRNTRPKPTPTYRKPPPYVPP